MSAAGDAWSNWTLCEGWVGRGRRRQFMRWALCENVYWVDWRPNYRRR